MTWKLWSQLVATGLDIWPAQSDPLILEFEIWSEAQSWRLSVSHLHGNLIDQTHNPLWKKAPGGGCGGVGNCSSGLPMAYYFWFLWLGESLLANDFMSMLFKLVAVFSTKIILIKKEICCLSDLGQNILNSRRFPIYKISISFSALFNLLGLLNGIKYMKFYKSCENHTNIRRAICL